MADIQVTVYGEVWCGDCRRAKSFLELHQVEFEWRDTGKDADARAFVSATLPGDERIPLVVFADGSWLVEPTDEQIAEKLGL